MTRTADRFVEAVRSNVPGARGVLMSSVDGFVWACKLGPDDDAASLAAMSAASIGLGDRLVRHLGSAPTDVSVHRSRDGQVIVAQVGGAAVLTVLAERWANVDHVVAAVEEYLAAFST
jgi:uncharacterized protein